VTQSDIQGVLDKEHRLTDFGIGTYHHGGETRQQRSERFNRDRACLLKLSPILSLICVWCSVAPKRKTVDARDSSYKYKHEVERDFGRYVTNGQFITAAIFCGIPYHVRPGDPNVEFAISRDRPRHRGLAGKNGFTPELPGEPQEWWDALAGTDGERLWRTVVFTPGDRLPRLVLADWLDERGLPHWASWLRSITDREQIAAKNLAAQPNAYGLTREKTVELAAAIKRIQGELDAVHTQLLCVRRAKKHGPANRVSKAWANLAFAASELERATVAVEQPGQPPGRTAESG
jgi:uncharacterized protein (TIGR02996 family)